MNEIKTITEAKREMIPVVCGSSRAEKPPC